MRTTALQVCLFSSPGFTPEFSDVVRGRPGLLAGLTAVHELAGSFQTPFSNSCQKYQGAGAAATTASALHAGAQAAPRPWREGCLDTRVGCVGRGSPNTHRTWVRTHLPRNDARSACSAAQHEGELADLRQPRGHDPLDVLPALRQEERQDQSCQGKLPRCLGHCLGRAEARRSPRLTHRGHVQKSPRDTDRAQ